MYEIIEALQRNLYFLGIISSIFFGVRFSLQWWQSEKEGRSVVNKTFWQLSIWGNLSLALHGAFQFQWPIALLQGAQAVLAKRNLELMRGDERAPIRTVFYQLILTLLGLSFLTIVLSFLKGEWEWMRVPTTPWSEKGHEVSQVWEILGVSGLFLFSSRFFIQWWETERLGESHLSPTFWSVSLIGAFLSSIYFWYSWDLINLMGPIFGSLSAVRNLILSLRR